MSGRSSSFVFGGMAAAVVAVAVLTGAGASRGFAAALPQTVPSAGAASLSGPVPQKSAALIAPENLAPALNAVQPAPDAKAAPPAPSKPGPSKPQANESGIDPEPDVAITPPPVPVEAPAPAAPSKPLDSASGTEVPLPPLNAAIKAALEKRDAVDIRGPDAAGRRKQRAALAGFYAARTFAPLWSVNGSPVPAVTSVLARLAHAGDDALNLPAPASLDMSGPVPDQAESDLALSEAVALYAREATGSRIDPRAIDPLIGFHPALADAGEVLKEISAAGSEAGAKLQAYNPSEPRYIALRKKLAELRAAHMPAMATTIPEGPALRIGMSDPRVPLVRARFSLDGTPDSAPQNLRYDTEVAAAVAGFQKANGLPASGVLTRRTIAALSGGSPSRLESELVANMEMWRWMPRDLGADRIEVNVPDFTVTVYRDGAAVSSNRVVVGKTKTPTPLFSNNMKFLIVNPVWNVPESIVRKEMMPKMAGDASYLSRLGYSVSQHNGRLVVKQPPGAKNALGRIKFMFPNDYAVYLHDTPSKSLFATSMRAFSHGCVRVDQPFRFGASVLGAANGWSEKKLEGMLGDKERYVYLPKPLPIHIEYFTASIDESGHLNLRDDVYNYVHRVAAALGQEG